jgi:methylated-DNA-[protein]-cysteine S-methyltransferase
MTTYTFINSPLGQLLLTSREGKLTGLFFADEPHARLGGDWVRQDDVPVFVQTDWQLEEYISGERTDFDLASVELAGSPWQMSVWQQIARIPFGQTISYGELAQRIGRTVQDARAVGTATGQNPVSWIIPCHRVVGKNGAMTGYAGGLPRKIALLDFEAARSAGRQATLSCGDKEPELVSV